MRTGGKVNVAYTLEDKERFDAFCNSHLLCMTCPYQKIQAGFDMRNCMDAFLIDTDTKGENPHD